MQIQRRRKVEINPHIGQHQPHIKSGFPCMLGRAPSHVQRGRPVPETIVSRKPPHPASFLIHGYPHRSARPGAPRLRKAGRQRLQLLRGGNIARLSRLDILCKQNDPSDLSFAQGTQGRRIVMFQSLAPETGHDHLSRHDGQISRLPPRERLRPARKHGNQDRNQTPDHIHVYLHLACVARHSALGKPPPCRSSSRLAFCSVIPII